MKTGGTALRHRLINHFGEAAVYPAKGLDGLDPLTPYISIDHMRKRLEARGREIRVVTGHFPLRTIEEIDGEFTTLTLLRDPVERMLSNLRQRREDRFGRRLAGRSEASRHAGKPLEAIYEDYRGIADNQLTKQLALTPAEIKASLSSPARLSRDQLERAEEALTAMGAYGLQERFEEFCEDLAARFGWQLGEPEVVNATAPLEASERLRAQIAEDNALDIELYEFAVQSLSIPGGSGRR